MSKFEVFDRCNANAIRHDLALIAKRLRAAREERSLSPHDVAERAGISEQQVRRMERGESDMGVLALARVARALEKDLDWFVSNVRTLQEHTERLWRKNANVTRGYPADFRFPAKKEILVDLGLWEPIRSASAEKHGL
jgi:transcriptional regulator with XRE-family HTH domain